MRERWVHFLHKEKVMSAQRIQDAHMHATCHDVQRNQAARLIYPLADIMALSKRQASANLQSPKSDPCGQDRV